MAVEFNLNGTRVSLDIDPETPLLDVLRNDLSLNGPKFGCGLAQCGACAVLLDGVSIRSCVTSLASAADKSVITLEGLGTADNPHVLQREFIDEQAIQCGYCANGVIMTAAALLRSSPSPDKEQIAQALSGHLCRCGAQPRMLKAIMKAVDKLNSEQA
jgi:nicotinate dehydrogenase subunit A